MTLPLLEAFFCPYDTLSSPISEKILGAVHVPRERLETMMNELHKHQEREKEEIIQRDGMIQMR
jgi:hypothetical protein